MVVVVLQFTVSKVVCTSSVAQTNTPHEVDLAPVPVLGLVVKHEPQHSGTEEEKGPKSLRELGTGAQILLQLGVRKMRLLTNTPRKIVGLEGFGLNIVEFIPLANETSQTE